jgi:choline-glycine betaine transporter
LVEPERVRHGFCHGFGVNLQENPIFIGKNHGFRLRFSLKPIQRDEFSTKWPCLWWFWWWIISG